MVIWRSIHICLQDWEEGRGREEEKRGEKATLFKNKQKTKSE